MFSFFLNLNHWEEKHILQHLTSVASFYLVDVCDFEEGNCNWQQSTNDNFDWVRQSGRDSNTGPETDHTTNTPMGYYYYVSLSLNDQGGQTATMMSPLYPAGMSHC